MSEKCQRCGEIGEDRRTLIMKCFYQMDEDKDIPFKKTEEGYTLLVCKNCRGDWMEAIHNWFVNPKQKESPGTGIYIRDRGATREVTFEEYKSFQKKLGENSK